MPVGLVGALVDDVAKVVEPAGVRRAPGGEPRLAALPALPAARGETEDLGRDAAALERPREDVGADRGNGDRPSTHRPELSISSDTTVSLNSVSRSIL